MRDTIEMAREAGLIVNSPYLMPHDNVLQGIKAFEALVRADEREKWMERTAILIRGEREACAKVCDGLKKKEQAHWSAFGFDGSHYSASDCAAVIRERGEN
jgi:hypothetical protein